MSSPKFHPDDFVSHLTVYELARQGKTQVQIVKICSVSESTLRRRYSEAFNRGKEAYRTDLAAKRAEDREDRIKYEGETRGKKGKEPREINNDEYVYEMARCGATKKSLMILLDIGDERFEKLYAGQYKKGWEEGINEILHTQQMLLRRGNTAMAIFLGKVRAGQREEQIQDSEKPDGFEFK